MRFFFSKRLPFGIRAGIITDPIRMGGQSRPPIRAGSALQALGAVCVYVITGPHGSKIGYSTDPEMRLAALQTGAHVPLKLHYVLAVQSIDPRQIEAEAHRLLDAHRMAGEWFDVPPEIAEEAVNRAAAHFGIQTVQTTSDQIEAAVAGRPVGPVGRSPLREFFVDLGKTFLKLLIFTIAVVWALYQFHIV